MIEPVTHLGRVREGAPFHLVARVLDVLGNVLFADDVTSIDLDIFDLAERDAGVAVHTVIGTSPAGVMPAAPTLFPPDNLWTVDEEGYNLRWLMLPGVPVLRGYRNYRFEFRFNLVTTPGPAPAHFLVAVESSSSA